MPQGGTVHKTMSDKTATQPPIPGCAQGCGFLAESHHRTTNQLALLAGYIRLKGIQLEAMAEPTPSAVRLFVQSIQGQIQSIARLHRLLSDGALAGVELSGLLPEVCAPFAEMYADRIAVVEDFAFGCLVRSDQSIPICQIVTEAIINSIKHARTDRVLAIICVTSRSTETGTWVEVSDNGAGLPDSFVAENVDGLGLRLMRAHARTLGGAITFESGRSGFKVALTVPPSQAPRA